MARGAARRQGDPVPDAAREPGDGRFPDPGDEAAEGRAARAHARRLRAILADRAPAGRHRRRQARRAAVRSRQARDHGTPGGLLEGIGIEVGGFSTNLALSTTGTLVYTTGSATRAAAAGVGIPRGAGEPGGLQPGSRRVSSPRLPFRPTPEALPWSCRRTATATSGSSRFRRDRSPGSPSATHRTCDPAWSADGRSLVYVGNAGTNGGTPMSRAPTAPGRPEAAALGIRVRQVFETRDGRWLVLRRSLFEDGGGRHLRGPRRATRPWCRWRRARRRRSSPAVSPDGRWVAYGSDESGVSEVYVRPFPDAASARWQVSVAGGTTRCGRTAAASCSTAAPPTRS